MKMLILIIFILLKATGLLAQDTLICPVENYDIPFEFKDDSNIKILFPKNIIPNGAKGIAIAPVVVDEKGILLKYCVNLIRIKDSTGNNSLIYYDYNMNPDCIHKTLSEMPVDKYPYYTRFIVTEIYKRLSMIKLSPKAADSGKKSYKFSIIFKLE